MDAGMILILAVCIIAVIMTIVVCISNSKEVDKEYETTSFVGLYSKERKAGDYVTIRVKKDNPSVIYEDLTWKDIKKNRVWIFTLPIIGFMLYMIGQIIYLWLS